MKPIITNDPRFRILKILAITAFAAWFLAHTLCREAVDYDALGAARRPLVLINGQQQQLPLADYLSSPGGMSLNATPATGSGDLQTTTSTSSGVSQMGGLKNTAQTLRTGKIVVPLTSTINDNLTPAGIATASQIDITSLTADYTTITGIVAQPLGTEIVLRNADPSYRVRLASGSSGSILANRFDLQFTCDLAPYQSATIRYESSGWVIVGSGFAGFADVVYSTVRSVLTVGQIRPGWSYSTTSGTSNDINEGDVVTYAYLGSGDAMWTGFLGGVYGRPLIIQNNTAYDLTLANETGSFPGRQLSNTGGVDIVLSGTPSGSSNKASNAVYVHDGQFWNLVAFTSTKNAVPVQFTSSKTTGTITLSGGTATATVVAGTHCICGDNTAANVVSCPVSGTTMTATGTGTDNITYHCF